MRSDEFCMCSFFDSSGSGPSWLKLGSAPGLRIGTAVGHWYLLTRVKCCQARSTTWPMQDGCLLLRRRGGTENAVEQVHLLGQLADCFPPCPDGTNFLRGMDAGTAIRCPATLCDAVFVARSACCGPPQAGLVTSIIRLIKQLLTRAAQ